MFSRPTLLCLLIEGLLTLGLIVPGMGQTPANSRADHTRDVIRRQLLQPALDMLRKKRVPFDQRLLLDDKWRELLGRSFEQMPELKQDVRIPSSMKGVYLAGTIQLSEHVELLGDTVILARELVPDDENSKITISGSYRLVIFVIGDTMQYEASRKAIRKHRTSDFLHIDLDAPCGVVGAEPVLRQNIQCRGMAFVAP